VPIRSLTIEQVLELLADAPPRLAALTAGLAPARLRVVPDSDGWSANDVLAHLRSCADVWGDCIAAILAQDRPTLRAINPRHWITRTDYPDQEFWASLHAFTAQRADLLAVLGPLPSADWARPATVKGAGTPLERTVLTYGQRLAGHEQSHLKQIARIIEAVRA
jgi:hypothetical protein